MKIPDYDVLEKDETKKENAFKKLLLIRCVREDRTMLAVNDYIK